MAAVIAFAVFSVPSAATGADHPGVHDGFNLYRLPSGIAQATGFLHKATSSPGGFPGAASKVALGRTLTYKVPYVIDPFGEFRPPAATVTMRLPNGVRYGQIRVVHVGKPIHPEYSGSGWFQGHGWGGTIPWGLAEARHPSGLDQWGFGWMPRRRRCDGVTTNLADGVRICESYFTIQSPLGEGHRQVLQLWKRATRGYLYLALGLNWRGAMPSTSTAAARGFNKQVFDEALAIISSARTRRARKPLGWQPGPTHQPTQCFGIGPDGGKVKLPPSDCGPAAGG
jgi:hypothetical protein